MPVFPNCDFPVLGDAETISQIRMAVASREPFSLIRLGDGEGVVLSFDEDMWLGDLAYLHGHWGAERVPLGAVGEMKSDLQSAVRGADIVGVRDDIIGVQVPDDLPERSSIAIKDFVLSEFHIRGDEVENLSAIGARRLALLHRVLSRIDWSERQQFCSAWIHWELLATGAINEILMEVEDVGLVTSRPELERLVAARFDVLTSLVAVPDKYIEAPEPGLHVPDRYRAIRSELNFPRGTVVLVGAGIPGKAYCQWLKEAGCVAIDVGSLFDAWVGKASRPRVLESRFNVAGGNRVPAELQLSPPTRSSGRRLTPRWKTSAVPK
jgi:GT-D fold-like domain